MHALKAACHVLVPCLLAMQGPRPIAILLVGQSNALYVAPELEHAYTRGPLETIAAIGVPIQHWNEQDGPLWPDTARALDRRPVRAIVFWQGESNVNHSGRYLADLRELIARMRARLRNASVRVVIVRVLEKPENAGIRAAQDEFTRTDANAVLISTDGLGLDTSDHLTAAGYRATAERVAAALSR